MKYLTRSLFPCLSSLAFSVSVTGTEEELKKTNIVVIMADDMGYIDVGCFA